MHEKTRHTKPLWERQVNFYLESLSGLGFRGKTSISPMSPSAGPPTTEPPSEPRPRSVQPPTFPGRYKQYGPIGFYCWATQHYRAWAVSLESRSIEARFFPQGPQSCSPHFTLQLRSATQNIYLSYGSTSSGSLDLYVARTPSRARRAHDSFAPPRHLRRSAARSESRRQ